MQVAVGFLALLLVVLVRVSAAEAEDMKQRFPDTDIWRLWNEKKPEEAIEAAKARYEAMRAALGPDAAELDEPLSVLALQYKLTGRAAEAEPLFKRLHELRERHHPPGSEPIIDSLGYLAGVAEDRRRSDEAIQLRRRAFASAEALYGAESVKLLPTLKSLAKSHKDANEGRVALYERALAICEKAYGNDGAETAEAVMDLANNIGGVRKIALYERALQIYRRLHHKRHFQVVLTAGQLLTALGQEFVLARENKQHAEALQLARRRITLIEEQGEAPDDFGSVSTDLVMALEAVNELSEAEQVARRSLALRETKFGKDDHRLSFLLALLARLVEKSGRVAEAESLLLRRRTLVEAGLGVEHANYFYATEALAELYKRQGRMEEAQPLFRWMNTYLAMPKRDMFGFRALQASMLSNMRQSLNDSITQFGEHSALVIDTRHGVAGLELGEERWEKAIAEWRLSTASIVRRERLAQRAMEGVRAESVKGERAEAARHFFGLVKAAWRLAEPPADATDLADEAFIAAQRAIGSDVSASITQMAARSNVLDPELRQLLRKRQDSLAEWHALDAPRLAALSKPEHQRDRASEALARGRLAEIERQVQGIDGTIAQRFPRYSTLADPQPLNMTEARGLLAPREALIVLLATPEMSGTPSETFVWVITREGATWLRSDLGDRALEREVAALRCGLDLVAWYGDGAITCNELLRRSPDEGLPSTSTLPFDTARSARLFDSLFGGARDMIAGHRITIVASGALARLPPQVLVKTVPSGTAPPLRDVDWLARDHAIEVLPSVSSLGALRRTANASRAPFPLVGFANPLLEGDRSNPDHIKLAREARLLTTCTERSLVNRKKARRGTDPQLSRLVEGGISIVRDEILKLVPLPETAAELCRIGEFVGARTSALHLGKRATKAAIRQMSASGQLARYRILHFATHGTVAGELEGTRQPGLILTPATDDKADDGYLSANEIAGLRLDADWVILSACNTASGVGHAGTEPLSGLARSFFYAGARAVLVSHWEVDSDATVDLVTRTVREAGRADAPTDRAEALRKAMLAMISNGRSHPAYWAPFVLVGDGGVRPP